MKDFCVVVAAKNEQMVISNAIRALLRANLSKEDIYVIDDGSDDKTGEYAKTFGVNILRNETNIGKARSIRKIVNHFKLESRYNFISTMDADTMVSPNYFESVRAAFEKNPAAAAVSGYVKNIPSTWLVSYRCMLYFMCNHIYRVGMSNMNTMTVAPGPSSTYRSSVFKELDWNNDTVVEDMDVTMQIHRKKLGNIIFDLNVIVYTQDPRTLKDYYKQITRWQTGNWQIVQKYKIWKGNEKIDWEVKLLLVEGIAFSCWILLIPSMFFWKPVWAMWSLIGDALVIFAFSVATAAVDRRWDVLYNFPMYPLMRFVDCYTFLKCFWKQVIQGENMTEWLHVKRY